MHIDFKITTWERVEIPNENKKEVMSRLEDETIESANDLFNYQLKEDDSFMNLTHEKLDNVSDQMTIDENNGCSTIEVWDYDDEDTNNPMDLVWDNTNEEL
jgi:predicted HAD superfamily phosphohydrolase